MLLLLIKFKLYFFYLLNIIFFVKKLENKLGIGDWGLGIGDWGLGPIPNPQSPIPNQIYILLLIFLILIFK